MRIRSARWMAGPFGLFLAWGCYSSVAPVPRIENTQPDTGLPPDGNEDASCVARKPWEGPGVTAVLPTGGTTALVISGELYFTADFDGSSKDASSPQVGRITQWRETGRLADLWSKAPEIVGQKPWDAPGITAVYVRKDGPLAIISRFRRWLRAGNDWVTLGADDTGSVVDDFLINDAGPPALDGQVPWEGPGITAAYFQPPGDDFFVISKDRIWQRDTSDVDEKNWTWADAGANLADFTKWSGAKAKPIGGQHPWEGKGVTTAYYLGYKFFVISADRMWTYDGRTWTAVGMLPAQADWSSAPTAGCE